MSASLIRTVPSRNGVNKSPISEPFSRIWPVWCMSRVITNHLASLTLCATGAYFDIKQGKEWLRYAVIRVFPNILRYPKSPPGKPLSIRVSENGRVYSGRARLFFEALKALIYASLLIGASSPHPNYEVPQALAYDLCGNNPD